MGIIKDKLRKTFPSFSSLFEDDLEDIVKDLKKKGYSSEDIEEFKRDYKRDKEKSTRSTGSTGSTKSKEEPVKKFRGGLMRKPKLAKRGF